MYRVGFGDCFLLSLPDGATHRHVLIDCGVHFKGDIKTMPKIVQDIRAETNDRIDLVVVTHAHQDHISGFGTHSSDWAKVTVREVWMPWTEDPTDAQAVALRTKQLNLAQQLNQHLRVTRRLTDATESILENFVGFNLVSNATAMGTVRSGFRGPPTIRYLEAGQQLSNAAGIPGFNIQVMSPSRDESVLKKMDPPAGQRWLRAGTGTPDPADLIEPFPNARRPRSDLARLARDCVLDKSDERQLQDAVMANDALALMLDDVLNNTSLVLLLRYKGSTLLFPGDAQWGNWSTWLERNGSEALLNEITFFKVGHHGSHNSTPRTVVPHLKHPEVTAMISTQGKPFKSIPKPNMVDELTTQCRKRVARSDWVQITGAPNVERPAALSRPFALGTLWIDYVHEVPPPAVDGAPPLNAAPVQPTNAHSKTPRRTRAPHKRKQSSASHHR
jgi:beta-lactamase superfamily II metal-dependent hydrolase